MKSHTQNMAKKYEKWYGLTKKFYEILLYVKETVITSMKQFKNTLRAFGDFKNKQQKCMK